MCSRLKLSLKKIENKALCWAFRVQAYKIQGEALKALQKP